MPIVEIGQCGISYPRAGLISLCSSDSGIMRLFMSNWTQAFLNTFFIYATYAYLCWNCICKALFVLRSRSMPLYSWVGLPVSSHLIFGLRLLLVFLNSINQWSCFCRFWPGSIMYVLNETWIVCHGSIVIPGYHGSIICSVGQYVYFTILQIYLFFVLCWKVKCEPFREFNNMTHAHLHGNARRRKTAFRGLRNGNGWVTSQEQMTGMVSDH